METPKASEMTRHTETESAEWHGSTCEFLILRVLRKEHADLRTAIRGVREQAKRAAEDSGGTEIGIVRELAEDLAAELAAHMISEENTVFPALLDLELAYLGEGPVSMPTREIEPLLRIMSQQHDVAGRTLERLWRESHGFRPPARAGLQQRELYDRLASLSRELRNDLRVENNILFPRATQIERELLSGSVPAVGAIA